MEAISGTSVFNQIAIGPLHYVHTPRHEISLQRMEDLPAELRRFEVALSKAVEQQKSLYVSSNAEVGEEVASVFMVHEALLKDQGYIDFVREVVNTMHCCAEAAVRRAGDEFAARMRAIDDPYFAARSADIEDITQTLLDILQGNDARTLQGDEPAILVAEEIPPSAFVRLDKSRVLGLVTRVGSTTSHTAIMARCMEIPGIVQAARVTPDMHGHMAILDGFSGTLYVDPSAEMVAQYTARREAGFAYWRRLAKLRGLPNRTVDGTEIRLAANISGLDDLPRVQTSDAMGVGLFRSEFVFMNSRSVPSEDAQFSIYKEALMRISPAPVTVRTCDLGADKIPDYWPRISEANPALGCRGIRFSLTHPELFKPQLRALLRAARYGKLRVMFPMVASVNDLREAKALLAECRSELTREGVPTGPIEVGSMIETPAAALCADELARECDFLSIGTNDLAQYTCALDRQSERLARFFEPAHPAVLKLIQLTVESAHRNNIPVGICGEMGSDQGMTEWFLRIGVDILSVNPAKILPLRELIRSLDLRNPPTPIRVVGIA